MYTKNDIGCRKKGLRVVHTCGSSFHRKVQLNDSLRNVSVFLLVSLYVISLPYLSMMISKS